MAKIKKEIENCYGYWMYKDGTSHWGIGTYRNDECPILISEKLHNAIPETIEVPIRAEGVKDEDWNKTVEDYNKAVEAAQPLAKKLAFYAETMKAMKDKREAKDTEEKEEKKAKK